MYKADIRSNAQLIWNLLCKNGAMSFFSIGEQTGFKDEAFIFMALGWLAREDKILFYQDGYALCVKPCSPSPDISDSNRS